MVSPAPVPAPRLLLVDDEPHVLRLLSLKLGGAGFEVATAANGALALAQLTACPPALVVSDLNMPVLDGLGLLRAMAADETLRQIPVVMLTGRGHTLPEDALALPFLARVERKPFSGRELLALVQELLDTPGTDALAA